MFDATGVHLPEILCFVGSILRFVFSDFANLETILPKNIKYLKLNYLVIIYSNTA